jgi:predicted outer membrane repeat protein
MKKSKLSILLLFLVMILAISAVSAADTNDTSDSDLQAVDEAPVDEVASADVDELESTDSNDVLSTGGGNFTELQDAISNPPDSNVITLTSNYTRVGDEGEIVIENSIVIDGDGNTIDGNNAGAIFKINHGAIVMLNNVILINGNGENGGAIYNEGTLIIKNCQFSNNNASLGGAIYNNGILDLSGSTFASNNATNGLSIYNNGNMSLDRNTINGPIVTSDEGIITSDIKVTVLDNEVKRVKEQNFILNAYITDDNGNVINQIGDLFKFTVDNVEVGAAVYNSQLRNYQYIYTLTAPGIYTVNVTYAGNKLKNISSKEKNLIYYKGTYTDLQEMINANTTLALKYDITYNDVVDADNFPSGVVIDKAITINGNGYTISGNNAHRIFNVTANDVVLTNVILTKGKADYGGAIYVDNGGNLTTDATFTNNNATYGGAIYTIADTTVDKSNFINNTAKFGTAIYADSGSLTVSESAFNEDEAVYIKNGADATISDSVFTSDKVKAINNFGTLSLAGNTVKAIYNDGTITSTINVIVLKGSTTVYADSSEFKLYANITDDNNNPISQSGFTFIINNQNLPATFNADTLLYEVVYTLPSFGNYDVNMTYTGTATDVKITNGTLTYIAGTFTDLERLIAGTPVDQTLELPYDFTYDAAFDGSNYIDGIVIDRVTTIDGKGHFISGSDAARIFNIAADILTLNNVTLTNGKADKGAAVYVVSGARLDADYVNFTDNTATYKGGAVYSEGTVKANHTVFDGNDIKYRTGSNRDFNGGAAIYNLKGTLTLDYSTVKNNVKNYGIRNATDYDNLDGAITSISGTVTISHSEFRNNSARYGSAILISSVDGADGTFTIDTCQFYDNLALAGAIQVWDRSNKFEFTILNSWFENNIATGNTTLGHTAAGGAIVLNSVKNAKINGTTFKGNKVIHIANAPKAGAINIEKPNYLPDAIVEVEIDNCTFENNHADASAGAINLNDGTLNVANSKFINNDATDNGGAINIEKGAAVVEGSNFTGNSAANGSAIYSNGQLTLSGNKVFSDKTEIVVGSSGTISSQINATVLDNKTHETAEDNYTLTAILTDDKGNLINDSSLKFIVNGVTAPNNSTFDASGVYTYADYPIDLDKDTYIVSVAIDGITIAVKTGTIKNLKVGTFTDLKAKLDAANGDLVLPYDFTYNANIDGDLKTIILNKTIDGNGHTINGNNSAAVFIVNADIAIKNTIFADVKEIYNNATLTLTNNTISQTEALIINNGTISNAVVNVLDGKTINLKFAEKVTLNATFKDDNGNLIKDDRFAFNITNVASPIKATYNNGLYTAEYTADKVEIKTVDVADIGIAAALTGRLNIAKADVVITIEANETIKRKQNESINITFKDESGNLLSLELQVYIKNSTGSKVYDTTVITTDGVSSLEVSGLGIDTYKVFVTFTGNDNYFTNTEFKDFEVIELDINNTFTELQRFIEAYEGTEEVLVLPHDFKYDDYVDEDLYAEGVLISKNITIDGNGTTIDSDKFFRLLKIADGITVTIANVTFINGNATAGAAILTSAASLTIDSCKFLNNDPADGGAIYIGAGNVTVIGATLYENNTAINGGAIYVAAGGTLTVNGATFNNNTAAVGGAIYVEEGGIVTLNGTTFTNNVDDRNYTIYNLGTLALDSNSVDKIIYNGGKITTPVYSTVLENATYVIQTATVELTAGLLDESGNKIYDRNFRFVANDDTIADIYYNATTGIYNATLNISPNVRAYVVNVSSANEEKLITKISIFKNITGTFTELQGLIDNTVAGDTLELPYDFAYIAAVDGDDFPEGVAINKAITIDGKGYTISGNNSNRIFRVTADTTLTNVSLVDGNAIEFGGAIYATANLNVYNSTFDHNAVSQNDANGGAIMVVASTASLTLNINNVDFTNNMVDNGGGAIGVAGVSGQKVVYNIYDSLFENNAAITTGTANAAGAAIFSYGNTKGLINNTIFRGNKAETGDVANGGAIKIQFGGTLTVANSTFDSNVANRSGGAISIQAYNDQTYLTVDNCTFINNAADHGSAIASSGYYDSTYVTITGSNFNEDNAVYLDAHTTAEISDSVFTSDKVYAIYNLGTLELAGNTVKTIFNNGTITTQTYSTVLENKTYNVRTSTYYINASLVDDNNNKIYDPTFRFVINGATNDTAPVYNADKGEYSSYLDTTTERVYVVDVISNNTDVLSTKTSIVKEITGTFTDLQELINDASNFLNLQYDFIYTPEIDDGSFDEGILISSKINIDGKGHSIIANNTRIFNVTAKDVILNNVTLVNGSAADGGAIYVADGGDLTVKAAVFEDNIATRGAIYVAYGGKLTVIGTTFNEDRAICNNGTASISTSEFTTEEIYAIYNLGTLDLSGNKVKLIFNNGNITSTVIATFIGGQTIAAELGDEVSPNATLTDDNENPIYDARFNITVRGTELETTYNASSYLYSAEYKIVNAGANIVSTNYPATKNTGVYDVPKANVTEFLVIPGGLEDRIPYGENVTIFVSLRGIDYEGLNEIITVVVNDTPYTVTISNGEGSFNVSGLDPGEYGAFGIFAGNDNYNEAYANGLFYVLCPETTLNVTFDNIIYGDNAVINISLTDYNGPLSGTIIITINGIDTVILTEGNSSVEIAGLPVGEYLVNVTYIGDDLHQQLSNDTQNITVFDDPEVLVPASADEFVYYGQDITIQIGTIFTLDGLNILTGNATIMAYDGDDTTVEPNLTVTNITVGEDGANVTIQLPVGTYMILIDFVSDDGYYYGETTVYTEVLVEEADVTVVATDVKYGEKVNITVTVIGVNGELLNGTLQYAIYNNETIETITVSNGTGKGEITYPLNVSSYTLISYFVEENGNYMGACISVFEVSKATPVIDLNDTELVYAEISELPFAIIGVNGEVIDGVVIAVQPIAEDYGTVIYDPDDGTGQISFRDLGVGPHEIFVRFMSDNNNYENVNKSIILTIARANITNLTSENQKDVTYRDPFNITVYMEGLVGDDEIEVNLTITDINGEVAFSDLYTVKNGDVITIGTDILRVGEYNYDITFDGDYTYAVGEKGNITSGVFYVDLINVTDMVTIDGSQITYSEIGTITVSDLPEDATGNVTVTLIGIDGEYTAAVEDGYAVVEIPGLSGNATYYTQSVVYSGDDVYASFTIVDENIAIEVESAGSELYLFTINDTTHLANASFTFIVVNATTVQVGVISSEGDIIYEANITDITEPLAFRTINLTNVPAAKYAVVIYNTATENYTGAVAYGTFVSEKIVPEMETSITPDIEVDDIGVEINITLPADVNGSVTVSIDTMVIAIGGVPVDGNLTITVPYDKLTAGNHTYTVDFLGDKHYLPTSASVLFSVSKIDPAVSVIVEESEIKYMGCPVVNITVADDATGPIVIDLNGEEIIFDELDENGTYSLVIFDLQAGEFYINVTYLGDDKYNKAGNFTVFTVPKANITNITAVNDENITYADDLEILVGVEGLFDNDEIMVILTIANATGDIVSGYFYTISVVDVITVYDVLPVGNYTYYITFYGDESYSAGDSGSVSASGAFEVLPIEVSYFVSINGSTITYGQNATVTVSDLPEDAEGNITVTLVGINGKYTAEIVDGVAVVVIPGLNGNNTYYVETVAYTGDDIYAPFIIDDDDSTIVVERAASEIYILPVSDTTHLGNTTFAFVVVNATAVYVAVVSSEFELIYEENITEIPANGMVLKAVNLTNVAAGKYSILIYNNQTDNYAAAFEYVSFVSEKIVPEMETSITPDIEVDDIGVEINITLPADVIGNVTVSIDTMVIAIGGVPVDGNLTITVPYDKLTAGNHTYTVDFLGDKHYLPTSASALFFVSKIDPTVSVLVDETEIGFMGSPVVNITVSSDATGPIVIDVNGEQFIFDELNDEGSYSFQIVDLLAGEFYINVTYLGDNKYNKAGNYTSFVVPKANATPEISDLVGDILYGEDITFTVTMTNNFACGNVTIFINGTENMTVILDEDYANATVTIPNLIVGEYTIGVKYNGNDNFVESDVVEFNVLVDKAFSLVTIDELGNQTYGIDVVVNYTVVNRTEVYVRFAKFVAFDWQEIFPAYELNDDCVVIHDLVPGDYMVAVYNKESEFYLGDSDFIEFTVIKAVPAIEIAAETAYYTSDFNISYSIDPETVDYVVIVVDANGTLLNYTVGNFTVSLSNLTTGYYYIGIATIENQNYTIGTCSTEFYVSIMDIGPQENSSNTVFSINLPDDASGLLLVDINGEHYYADVVNGTASIPVPKLAPGNYSANVTYTGDDKYPGFKTTQNVTVESNLPENALTIPNSTKSDEPTIYSINITNGTGYLEVDVDGTKYVEALVNGTASVAVPPLSEGNHNITVTYTGDDRYTPDTVNTTLNVTAPVFKLTNNKNVKVIYSGKASYKVLVLREGKAVGAGESVTFNFNGKKYTVKTDAKGYATLKLNTKIKVGKYAITAEYKGVKVTNKVTIKQLIKAKKAKVKKSKKVNKIKVKTKKVNGKYLKGKKLKLTIKKVSKSKSKSAASTSGKSASKSKSKKVLKAKINKKGKATFKLTKKFMKKLKPGKKYTYTVSYGNDQVTKKLKVKK